MSSPTPDPTALTHTFSHTTPTHTFTLHWATLGSPTSPPLIFIHGTPWSSRVFSPYALALSRTHRVYLFDNPGFGCSPLEQELSPSTSDPERSAFVPKDEAERLDADLARQTSAFAALFAHWQETEGWTRKPSVVAHDHGGLMALRANLLHDCQYASLCLIDVVAIGPFGQPLFSSISSNPKAFSSLPDLFFEGLFESYIRNAAHKTLDGETMAELKQPWMREGGKEGFVRQLRQAAHRSTEEVEERYKEVGRSMRVKVIWGKEDRWIDVADAYRLGDALGAKEVVVIEGAGHLVMYDQPGHLGIELGVWLAEVGR